MPDTADVALMLDAAAHRHGRLTQSAGAGAYEGTHMHRSPAQPAGHTNPARTNDRRAQGTNRRRKPRAYAC